MGAGEAELEGEVPDQRSIPDSVVRRSMKVEMRRGEGRYRIRGRRRAVEQGKNVENEENEGREKVERAGLKKETREAEGMGLLQWQRRWGGSPDRLYDTMNDVLPAALRT